MDKDSLVLGRIKEIHKYKLVISLPYNKTGVCLISTVSEQYNFLLSKLVDDDSIQNEISNLNTLFTKGQFVQVKLIKSINGEKFDLSLMPSAINSNISIERLQTGIKLQAAIKSREDKGYILETGIGGLNAFLPFENCFNEKYEIGKIIQVCPIVSNSKKSGNSSRVMNFSVDPKLKASILPSADCDFVSILPGVLIKSMLKANADGNLEGKFQGFPITVKSGHHKTTEDLSQEQTLCVISVDGSLKQLDCSLLPHLRPPFRGLDELLDIQIGYSEKNCTVVNQQKSNMVLSIPNRKFATVIVKKSNMESTNHQLPSGSTIVARYIDYNLMDNVVIATTLARLLSLSYFSVHQAKLGEMIKGTIKNFTKHGYSVQISSNLVGLIPIPHLSDKPIHNANTLYKVGESVQCRVFHIDVDENKLLLTVKKSLMYSKLPIISGFSDLQNNMIIDGFIAKIMDFGLVIILFNNMKGWVPISRVPESKRKALHVSYHVGQPVEVEVIRWNESTDKIELSLIATVDKEEHEDKPENTILNNINIGDIYEAVIKTIKTGGFNVQLLPINIIAYLPFEHLSDSREHRSLLQAHYTLTEKEENKISVVVINTHNDKIKVSKKNSLISASASERMLINIDKLSIGSQWIGWITKKESYGLFVELPCGMRGLVRNKDICDYKPIKSQPIDLFEIGDTVEAKILEIDEAKNKCLFSLKMSDTYKTIEHMRIGSLDFLTNHLEERKYIKSTESCKKLHGMEIGNVVNVEITKKCEWGFTLTIKQDNNSDNIVAGFVRNQLLPDHVVSEGSIQPAIIIDIDLKESSVEVCMIGSMINAVVNKNNHCTTIDIGQTIPSDVLFFNNDFVVAMLKNHAHGNIVYIPTKRFWNDATKQLMWIIKQRNPTIIKSIRPNDIFIGSLSINEAIDNTPVIPKPDGALFKSLIKKIKLSCGQEHPVYFHSITKNKLFYFLSKRQKGFCNLIEYTNNIDELERLMTNPPARHTLLDKKVTIDSAVMKTNGLSSGHFLTKNTLEVGDLVCCKVISLFKRKKYRLKLPFNLIGFIDPKNLKKKLPFKPRIGNVIQCVVDNIATVGSNVHYFMNIVGLKTLDADDRKDKEEEEEEEEEEEDVKELEEKEDNEMEVDNDHVEDCVEIDNKEEEEQDCNEDKVEIEELPKIVTNMKTSGESLSSVYKRIHHSDDDEDEENNNSENVPTPAKQAKLKKLSNVERELLIRKAEKRRETGEFLKDPQNDSEFELLLFNYPNDANSWIKFMKFHLDSKNIDKARAIAERAMKTLQLRDSENRFKIMKEYIDLEIDQLVLTDQTHQYDDQYKRFRKIIERGLTQKSKLFYIHVCDKLIRVKLFNLAEEMAKRFVKEFHFDCMSWYHLFLVRFIKKEFNVVKETITNAERSLKAVDFKDLQIRVAETEIERGDIDRGVQSLIEIFNKKSKDIKLKKRIVTIFEKNNLSHHASKLEALSMN